MNIIDAHQHFWQYDSSMNAWISDDMTKLRRDFMPLDLKQELDAVGMDGCIAVQADQTEEETDFLLQLAHEYSFIKGVVGWLDLRADDIEQKLIHYATNSYLKGIRHIVQDEPDDRFLLQPDFLRGVEKLKEFDLCYDILIYAHQLPAAVEFVDHFPDHRFVLNHIAKPDIKNGKMDQWREGMEALAEHPHTYCKLSGMVTEADWNSWRPSDITPYIDVAFDTFGANRLLFGSDWPVCTVAADYETVFNLIEDYIQPFSLKEQAMIMGRNAKLAYKL